MLHVFINTNIVKLHLIIQIQDILRFVNACQVNVDMVQYYQL